MQKSFFRREPGLYGIFIKIDSVFIHSIRQNATRNPLLYLLNFRDILLIPCLDRIKPHICIIKQL